jgi:beta-1,4-mannooligosaccharide/beta-1,4-mannosyl-N-acetylglucosamine phosphorylase
MAGIQSARSRSSEKELTVIDGLLKRHPENPILTHVSLPFLCNAIYNPGAVKFGDLYVLIPRVEDGRRDNRLHVAMSDEGVHFTVNPDPIPFEPDPEMDPWEKHRYDPRVTFLEGQYYILYCAENEAGVCRIGAVRTSDFEKFERLPFMTPPWNRNAALFPEKIGGQYARLERPMGDGASMTFVSYSPDLEHWGGHQAVNLKVETWLSFKWGIGPTPIKTDDGWLLIFHGVWRSCNGLVYRLGVCLLDLEEPSQVIAQCPEFIITPRTEYERVGDVPNCIFSNGAIVEPDGVVRVYYGACDTSICLATTTLPELVSACRGRV